MRRRDPPDRDVLALIEGEDEAKRLIREKAEIHHLLRTFFHEDLEKIDTWLHLFHPVMGQTPARMMELGRTTRLLKWIRIMRKENGW